MKIIAILFLSLLVFTACSESEKQQVINAIQDINIKNDIEATTVTSLENRLSETSGLAYIDGTLWSHNDSGSKAELNVINQENGTILKTVTVSNATNVDWEDLAFNDTHLFIGDFGNNQGMRQDLVIYKIKLTDLQTKTTVEAEKISFSYADQTDFTKNANTNYDCEAFIAYENELYLFSKNHGNEQTNMYKLSTNSGTEVLEKIATYNSNALITGASIDSKNKVLALIGYSAKGENQGTPKTWIFSEFTDANFFEGTQDKLTWGTPLKAQIEGVTHLDTGKLYIASEKLNYSNSLGSFTLNQELYKLVY